MCNENSECGSMNESYLRLVLACGVHRVAWVDIARDVVFDAMFRDICVRNACGQYGNCHMCPPDIGDIHELMTQAQSYDYGLLYQTVGQLEDCFDIEGMQKAGRYLNDCASRIRDRLMGREGLLHLASGGCKMCARCTKRDGLPCPFPELALSSMEAYGIDVYNTARNAGLKYNHGRNTVTFFGMVLIKNLHE
jgi:predicted metal-binding protein